MGLETQIFEESPMTESEEKELVIVKTAIKTAYADKLERDLAIGAGLLQIFRRKLYRGPNGGRSWDDWLSDESAELTAGRGAINKQTSLYLRGFYQFRVEVLQPACSSMRAIPLPASPAQVRPLLAQLDNHPQAALEMWKAAVADAKGKVPSFDQVNRAALAYKANEANNVRRMSAAQQAALNKANAASRSKAAQPLQSEPGAPTQPEAGEGSGRGRDYSPQPAASSPTIPAWEMEKDDNALDAGAECKRITHAITDAHKAIGMLRGILYSQINKYGRDYLGFLRQVDAGVYSLHNIDDQVQQMGEDIDFIFDLLTADVGEGELAKATVDAVAFPTRA
jgi:hypothetical protein